MLQLSKISQNTDSIIKGLELRNFDGNEAIKKILAEDAIRKETQQKLEEILSNLNKQSKIIGQLFKEGNIKEANKAKEQTTILKKESKQFSEKLTEIETSIKNLLYTIPNIPHSSVPKGNSENDNELITENGKVPQLYENAKPHWELATKYDIIDFELGSKITGSGFPVYKGKGARLQRALINFFLDQAEKSGYKEMQPPILVNEESGYGTGQLPDKDAQMYHVGLDNLYLSPTAEVPLTNIYRNTILNQEDLPIKITAYTPCFRREAGSYGKDVKGLNRLHQFDKVEIVQITEPSNSYNTLEEMCNYVEEILNLLELPYRKVKLCGGDLGFTSALTYDMEVYSAAQEKWLEVSSISNFENYQANRLKLRYRNNQKKELVHTLNGSALALPRIVAALLENNQNSEGINIPKALQPYTVFEKIN